MKVLNINVIDKIAESIDTCIVCGNSDYEIKFAFDEEWQNEKVKTARFIFNGAAVDVVFEGDSVAVPVLTNVTTLAVGVFAGDLRTTTPALISCKKSILCEDGTPPDPTPEVYAQIIKMLNATNEQADNAVATAKKSQETAAAALATVNETWVLLGEYDLSLAENQVAVITINKYNGQPFIAKKIFVYGTNVNISANYADIGTEKGYLQWGFSGNHSFSYLFPLASGTFQLCESSNTYFTSASISPHGQPFTATAVLPANSIKLKGRNCNFTKGKIKVWAVIEQ